MGSISKKCQILFLLTLTFVLSNCKDKPTNTEQVAIEESNKSTNPTEVETKKSKKSILFYGDSLTAGYGLSEEESFPSLVQRRLDSLGYDYQVINAGLSGETTAGGVGRIDWVLQQAVDIFVLELGANDMLRGLDITTTQENLRKILDTVQDQYPDVKLIIAGMQSPPNMGPDYSKTFNSMYKKIAEEYNALLIPFLLEGVAGDPELNLPDMKHPNATGQKLVLENVWKILKQYL